MSLAVEVLAAVLAAQVAGALILARLITTGKISGTVTINRRARDAKTQGSGT